MMPGFAKELAGDPDPRGGSGSGGGSSAAVAVATGAQDALTRSGPAGGSSTGPGGSMSPGGMDVTPYWGQLWDIRVYEADG